MQGTLKGYEPKKTDGYHDKFKELFKFIVTIEENGKEFKGEAFSQSSAGSKNWKVGALHNYEKKENSNAEGGYGVKSLKVIEASKPQGGSPTDKTKESFVVSRFAHQFALEYLNSLNDEERGKLINDLGVKEIVSKLAKTMAKSVYKVALEIQKMDEGGDVKAP